MFSELAPLFFLLFLLTLGVSLLYILKPEFMWKHKAHLFFREPTPFILWMNRLVGIIFLIVDLFFLYLVVTNI